MKVFIAEFEASHPGVKINMTGKGGDDLNTGIVSSATSNTIPDIYMGTTSQGALFTKVKALANVYDKWMAMPEAYRAQFNPDMIGELSPKEGELWGMPFTGYATFLYRNLNVLKAAGIDPAAPITDWTVWLEQMKAIKDSGNSVWVPSTMTGGISPISIVAQPLQTNGALTLQTKTPRSTRKVPPDSQVPRRSQSIWHREWRSGPGDNRSVPKQQTRLHRHGPVDGPNLQEAAKNSGLDYDYVLIPGATADNKGGVKGTEFIGFAPNGKNLDLAWEFATYICDEPQLTRWGQALGRYNSNNVAISK